MPFQRMPNTVPADAEYRSSGCRIPFQRMPNTVPADALSTGRIGLKPAPGLSFV